MISKAFTFIIDKYSIDWIAIDSSKIILFNSICKFYFLEDNLKIILIMISN